MIDFFRTEFCPIWPPALCFQCEMYADAGFDDILYGFPFIPSHFDRVFRLSQVREEERGGEE